MARKVVWSYEATGRGESCLVAGFTDTGKPIQVVCGERGNWLVVITAYILRLPKSKITYERGEK